MDTATTTSEDRVTLEMFASRVSCHFTTASRLKAGYRLPGRELLGRIVKAYRLNEQEAFEAFVGGRETFGKFLSDNIFNYVDEEDGYDDAYDGRVAV